MNEELETPFIGFPETPKCIEMKQLRGPAKRSPNRGAKFAVAASDQNGGELVDDESLSKSD